MRKLFHSYIARLLGLFIVCGAGIIVTVYWALMSVAEDEYELNLRPHLLRYASQTLSQIGSPPETEKASKIVAQTPLQIRIEGPELSWDSGILNATGDALNTLTYYPLRSTGTLGEVLQPRNKNTSKLFWADNQGQILLKLSDGPYTVYMQLEGRQWNQRITIAIACVIAIYLLMYQSLLHLFKPVTHIRDGVEKFSAGDFSFRIPQKGGSGDLSVLTDSINDALDQIERLLQSKRQLLLAISHELRSPITRARLTAELLEDQESQQKLISDLKEMEHLLKDLLESERLNDSHVALKTQRVVVYRLIQELIAERFSDQPIELQCLLNDPNQSLSLDATRIKVLIANLISNALRFRNNQPIHVRVSSQLQHIAIAVIDFGSGIEKRHLSRLTEPFYRPDQSRNRSTGGTGLGLYLSKLIAHAHGGTLTINSQINHGTQVVLLLPLQCPDHPTHTGGTASPTTHSGPLCA